ncbi:MAG: hypothetical protein E6K81_13985 [Candidatus Eisenbacteria bacterium]|uniref:Uncharacterized protein n=1 Tax=Eiseniibacteriota bacterium TaxID=2212470 RepID=A0A538U1S5_UNCEI|nr:MAG: hypothetical protein E6K81_13985 [Candidatus Eisenbacteria bacterium]
MCTFNNNYRIQSKANGATILTLGPATFWNPVITNKALLGKLTDPRCTYDPFNNRWIVASQTTNNPGQILFGVSQNADPAGNWFLYSVTLGGSYLIDFPTLGFNKNWICVSINQYNSTGTTFTGGVQVVADYGAARAGTLSGVSTFTGAGTRFCAAPCVTVSATEDTLFVPTHLGSMAATFQVDVITGTPSTPVYTRLDAAERQPAPAECPQCRHQRLQPEPAVPDRGPGRPDPLGAHLPRRRHHRPGVHLLYAEHPAHDPDQSELRPVDQAHRRPLGGRAFPVRGRRPHRRRGGRQLVRLPVHRREPVR